MTVRSGSYVLPADVVGHGAESNTIAGFSVLKRMFVGMPRGEGSTPYRGAGGPYNSGAHPYDQGAPLPYGAHAHGGAVKHAAAGILFSTPEDKVLLLRRAGKDHVGEWALPAGGIEKGETPAQAARRETEEEAGHSHTGALKPLLHTLREGVDFTTFVAHGKEFEPRLNHEHDGYCWITPKDALADLPLHPGVKRALEKFREGRAAGGRSSGVPIVAAGGEFVLSPEQVKEAGAGDLERGHRVLDKWVLLMRKDLIKTLKKLPGPARN
jgi:8-oxo-dGTP pyrophosphatase MutT (NUDIX family)